MVNWKIALLVIVIAILVTAIGMWFGYQYVSEQDDISPEGWREPSETLNLCSDTRFVFALTARENPPAVMLPFPNTTQSLCSIHFPKKGDLKYEIYQICVLAESTFRIKPYM